MRRATAAVLLAAVCLAAVVGAVARFASSQRAAATATRDLVHRFAGLLVAAGANRQPIPTSQADCEGSPKFICGAITYTHDHAHPQLRHPDPKGAHLLTRAQVVRQRGGKGVTVSAILMTYGAARGFASGLAAAPRAVVDPSRKVWVVTDYYDPARKVPRAGGWGKVLFLHDSFVIDAATNTVTDACQGCAVVPASNTSWPAAATPTVSKAQWAADLRRGWKTKTVRVRLVWGTVGMGSVDLEWLAYAPHGTETPISAGPLGSHGHIRPYRGPVGAVIGAFGGPPEGSWTQRSRHHSRHGIRPLESRSIPVALVRALARKGFRTGLTSYLVDPAISRGRALDALDSSQVARHIWLVYLFGNDRTRLTWLIERRDRSYAFVSARSGNVLVPSVKP